MELGVAVVVADRTVIRILMVSEGDRSNVLPSRRELFLFLIKSRVI